MGEMYKAIVLGIAHHLELCLHTMLWKVDIFPSSGVREKSLLKWVHLNELVFNPGPNTYLKILKMMANVKNNNNTQMLKISTSLAIIMQLTFFSMHRLPQRNFHYKFKYICGHVSYNMESGTLLSFLRKLLPFSSETISIPMMEMADSSRTLPHYVLS
jgi:hypothetical protein